LKQSIEAHTTQLINRKASLEKKELELKYIQMCYDAMLLDVKIYEVQIERAIREGLDGFDEDKFNKKKLAKRFGKSI